MKVSDFAAQLQAAQAPKNPHVESVQIMNRKTIKSNNKGRKPHPNRHLFDDYYEQVQQEKISAAEVQRILGISDRTYYNWAEEYKANVVITTKPVLQLTGAPVINMDILINELRIQYERLQSKDFIENLMEAINFNPNYKLLQQHSWICEKALLILQGTVVYSEDQLLLMLLSLTGFEATINSLLGL